MVSAWSKIKQQFENLVFHLIRGFPSPLPGKMAHQHSCCHHDDNVRAKTVPKSEDPPFHTSFHLFPQLLPEIRAKIWALTLPGPRVLHVRSSVINNPAILRGEYTTSPISYGGNHPIALHVCQESRGEALRTLTPKFNAFWNLKQDTLYVEMRKWGADDAMMMIADMRTRGLLDDFKHLALDFGIWKSSRPEHW